MERLCNRRIFSFFDEQLAKPEPRLFGNLRFQRAEAGGRVVLFPLVQRNENTPRVFGQPGVENPQSIPASSISSRADMPAGLYSFVSRNFSGHLISTSISSI